jgi:hypothetical protein
LLFVIILPEIDGTFLNSGWWSKSASSLKITAFFLHSPKVPAALHAPINLKNAFFAAADLQILCFACSFD